MKRLALHGEAIMRYVWQDKKWPNLTWKVDKLSILLGKCRFAQGQLLARIQSLGMGLGLRPRLKCLNRRSRPLRLRGLNPQSVRHLYQTTGAFVLWITIDRYIDGLVEVLLDIHHHSNHSQRIASGVGGGPFPYGIFGMHPWPRKMAKFSTVLSRDRWEDGEAPPGKIEKNTTFLENSCS